MKIALASDIHTEFFWRQGHSDLSALFPTDTDIIVLAGDIGVGETTAEVVLAIAESFPNSKIVWIAGNHEFYGSHISELLTHFRSVARQHPRIYFLEQESVLIDGFRFMGCILWSSLDALGTSAKKRLIDSGPQWLSDFQRIQWGKGLLTPEGMRLHHKKAREWLQRELVTAQEHFERTVVVTHFPPSPKLVHGNILENELTPYFINRDEDLIHRYQPELWVYGHNHWSNDQRIGNTRCISNQPGYPGESCGFRKSLFVTI